MDKLYLMEKYIQGEIYFLAGQLKAIKAGKGALKFRRL